jgi:hypothetical protein
LPIFCEKMAFFSNTNVMIKFFQKRAVVWAKNANTFGKFFGKNIFKIICNIGPWIQRGSFLKAAGRQPGLPDGLFSDQKIAIWVYFGRFCNGGRLCFYGHLVYFTAISYIACAFCVFCGNLDYFPLCGYIVPKKSGAN